MKADVCRKMFIPLFLKIPTVTCMRWLLKCQILWWLCKYSLSKIRISKFISSFLFMENKRLIFDKILHFTCVVMLLLHVWKLSVVWSVRHSWNVGCVIVIFPSTRTAKQLTLRLVQWSIYPLTQFSCFYVFCHLFLTENQINISQRWPEQKQMQVLNDVCKSFHCKHQ